MHLSTALLTATLIASAAAAPRPVVDLGPGTVSSPSDFPALPANPALPALPALPANPANPTAPNAARERREMLAMINAVDRRDVFARASIDLGTTQPATPATPEEPAEPATPAKPAGLPVRIRADAGHDDADAFVRRDDILSWSTPATPGTPATPATPATPKNNLGL